ncbi:MAG: AMP-binding protein [Nannocystaceae bacterium]
MSTAVFHLLDAFRDGDLVAIGESGARSVEDLRRDVHAVAAALPRAAGGEVSEVVVVCSDRYHFAVGVLAAWEAGHGVALPPNTQPEVVRHLSRKPGVIGLLHDSESDEGIDLRAAIAVAGRDALAAPPLRPIEVSRHVATIYTSGTTGEHQACAKTAGQLLGEAAVLGRTFGLAAVSAIAVTSSEGRPPAATLGVARSSDALAEAPKSRPDSRPSDRPTLLATVPPVHIYGLLFGVLMPLLAGARFVRDTPFHAETVAATARRHAADVLISVPVHLRSLTVLEASALPRFRRVFSSGAPLPVATAEALIERFGIRVTEVFGSSETGGIAWRVSETCREPWQPLPGVKVAADPAGLLLVDSPFLPPSEPRPYAAGDRIEPGLRGGFHLLGRDDGILKIAGKRVSLAEIEQRLLALPGVSDGAVAAVTTPGARGHELMAAVVVRAGAGEAPRSPAAWAAALRRGLLEWFDPVVVPRRIRVVDLLPREANGKLRRQRLLEVLEIPREHDPAALAGAPQLRVTRPAPVRRPDGDPPVFAVRSHAVRRRGGHEVHEIAIRVAPGGVGPGPALARMLAQVLSRVAGLGRPHRIQGAGVRQAIAPGDALSLTLEVDRPGRRVRYSLRRGDETCASGIVDYVRVPEASVG